MNITVVGTGYVGLVAGACFADTGNQVICVDKDEKKVAALRQGRIPIFEPGLETLVHRGMSANRLKFVTQLDEAMKSAEVIFLAVGTPSLSSGEPNLEFLKTAAHEIGKAMTDYCIIVNKSTVPVGAHQWVADWIKSECRHPFDVASNPEFLKEGSALEDFLRPDRVIIGTTKDSVFKKIAELYAPFVRQGNPILRMDPISAELTKYACNSFLATRISFMNELAVLCDQVGGDIEEIRRGMMTDARIGKHFLYAGVGYGGSCFPKDVQALMSTGKKNAIPLGIIMAAEAANQRQKLYLPTLVRNHFKGELSGKTFGIWGLSFKPNTDDMRDAPSLTIIDELLRAGARIQCYDPVSMENAKAELGDRVHFCGSSYEVPEGADALLIVTEWNEFRNPDFDRIQRSLRTQVIFDGRNLYDPIQMKNRGFTYYGIGRGQH